MHEQVVRIVSLPDFLVQFFALSLCYSSCFCVRES